MSTASTEISRFLVEDYLAKFESRINTNRISETRRERSSTQLNYRLSPCRDAVDKLPVFKTNTLDLSNDIVTIGSESELTDMRELFMDALNRQKPWKKGPFNLFGTEIDAEWKSHLKWNRILPHLEPMEGKRIADIGCNNGYFMFRMADHNPDLVIGFDPFIKYWFEFHLLQRFAQIPSLHFELLGVEHLDFYPAFFDTIFCLGILYHHTDPVGLLRKIHSSMATGAQIIVDCQGIPGNEPMSLTPKDRYAGSRGIWFLPTAKSLEHWLHRSSFRNIEVFFSEPLSTDEQRPTSWAEIESLGDFLDPKDNSRTIEGYPAPYRIYAKATK